MITTIKDLRTLADDEHRTREERGADCGFVLLYMFAFDGEPPNTHRRTFWFGEGRTPYEHRRHFPPLADARWKLRRFRARNTRGNWDCRTRRDLVAVDGSYILKPEID
jgi:hypothetical protein